jgi:hypothetical protein
MNGSPDKGLDAAHHAKVIVDEAAPIYSVTGHVSGMRVSMEEAIPQKLLQVRLNRQPRQTIAVQPHGINRICVVDFDTCSCTIMI